MIKLNIITLFPDFFKSPLKSGILSKAIKKNLIQIHFINPRNFTDDKHHNVDDRPFGGGDGMVMLYKPLQKALQSISTSLQSPDFKKKVIYLSPQGQLWNPKIAKRLTTQSQQKKEELVFVCGRYSGIDQRFINQYVDEEISIGDYILTGGEPAMLVVLDSLARYVKGVLGNEDSSKKDSFETDNLLEAPQWTRPQKIKNYEIPKVILSGHHKQIKHFQYLISVLITSIKRPDLLKKSPSKVHLPQALKLAKSLSEEELKACGLCLKDLTDSI